MDERIPCIHTSIILIVNRECRKVKEGAKKSDIVRLCADYIMTRTK